MLDLPWDGIEQNSFERKLMSLSDWPNYILCRTYEVLAQTFYLKTPLYDSYLPNFMFILSSYFCVTSNDWKIIWIYKYIIMFFYKYNIFVLWRLWISILLYWFLYCKQENLKSPIRNCTKFGLLRHFGIEMVRIYYLFYFLNWLN